MFKFICGCFFFKPLISVRHKILRFAMTAEF